MPADQPAPIERHTLTVALVGTGAGTVTGPGIACPGTCSSTYPSGGSPTLTAVPADGSTFAGWTGDCSGSGSCQLTLGADRSVSATFTATSPKPSCTLVARGSRVSAKKKPRGVLKLTALCNQDSRVTVTGTIRVAAKKKGAKAKTFRIAAVSRPVQTGKPLSFTVKVPKKALKLLTAKARESASFTLTASNANGTGTALATIKRLRLARGGK
jgi:hypothetical protein